MLGGKVLDRWVGQDWRGSSGEHRSILVGLVAVGIFAVLGKLVSAAKEMAVAWRFGVSAQVDAYLLVLNLVNWPVAIWFGALTVLLIPLAARLRLGPPENLKRFRAELLAVTLVLGSFIVALGFLLLPPLLRSSWLGLPPQTAALAVQITPVLVWLPLPGLLVGLYSTWTMSMGRHGNTLLEGVPAFFILIAVLAMAGIGPLVWGTLIGTVLQVGLLALPVRQAGELESPAWRIRAPEWTLFWSSFGIVLLGQAILNVTTLVDQFFAAHLGEGAISSLGYATRIIAMVIGIAATAVTRATLPVFSRQGASTVPRAWELARHWSVMMGLAGIALTLVGWLVAPLGVRLLFQRGTFSAADSTRVTEVLRLGLLQLPFYLSSLVLVSLRSSLGHYRILLLTGIVGLVVKVIACYLLIPSLGVGALSLSLAFVYAANTLVLLKVRTE